MKTNQPTNQLPNQPTALVMRKTCACGKPMGPAGECAACLHKKRQNHHLNSAESRVDAVPESVHEALRTTGQPLHADTRLYMGERFGHDFSSVRIHNDQLASESAHAVNARAYTVGRNIVFGKGEYSHQSSWGRALIAHELIHVVQQGFSATPPKDALQIASSDSALEREADNIPHHAVRKENPHSHLKAPAQLARWALDKNIATVTDESDRLGQLPGKVNSSPQNWVCIRPIAMKTVSYATPPADFEQHYENYLQLGDQFDVSNLQSTFKGAGLKLSLFDASEAAHTVLSTLYPGTTTSKNPDSDIEKTSGEGKTPLADLLIGGHQTGGRMYGKSGSIEPSNLSADTPIPTYSRAHDSKFPRRCWFTHWGNARSVGCSSNSFGTNFAAVFLRKGAGIDTTTRPVAPTCTNSFRDSNGDCTAIDAIEFRPNSDESRTGDHGPFKLNSASDFHASIFWSRIAGGL